MSKESSITIDKVAYGITFPDLKFGNSRPGVVEATLKPGHTLEDALDELDDRLNAWHRKKYPHLYQDVRQNGNEWMAPTPPPENWEIPKQPAVIDYKKFEQLEIDIDNAQTSEELEAILKQHDTFPGKLLPLINAKRQSFKL